MYSTDQSKLGEENMFKFSKILSLFVLASMLLAACGGGATTEAPATEMPATEAPTMAATEAPTEAATQAPTEAPAATSAPGAALRDPKEVALEAAGGQQLGGTINILGVWSGGEEESWNA